MPAQTKEKARSLPNNLEAEESLLGCVLVDADLAADILAAVKVEDFYTETHRIIVTAMKAVS